MMQETDHNDFISWKVKNIHNGKNKHNLLTGQFNYECLLAVKNGVIYNVR